MGIAIYLISNIIYHCGEFIFVLKYHIMDLKWGSIKKNIYIIHNFNFLFLIGFLINHST